MFGFLYSQSEYLFKMYLPKDSSCTRFPRQSFIHSDIGIFCYGAKINGSNVNVTHKTKTGDRIDDPYKNKKELVVYDWLTILDIGKSIFTQGL